MGNTVLYYNFIWNLVWEKLTLCTSGALPAAAPEYSKVSIIRPDCSRLLGFEKR